MGGQQRSVTRQAETQRLGEAIHRIGGKHTRARTAGRAGRSFIGFDRGIVSIAVGGDHHGVDQIELVFREGCFACFHRPTRDKDHWNIESHGGVEHARCDLVAIGNADHGVGTVRIDHVLNRVGNQVAGGQTVEHPVVAHGNTVIYGNGVEFLGDTARGFDLPRYQLPQILEVHMARHELGKGVHHGNDGFFEVAVLHTRCTPQRAGAGHVASSGRGAGSILRHRNLRGVRETGR